MEKGVNQRIIMLKKELGLTDIQFCGRADISTFTLHKIKNNEEVSQKIVFSIAGAFEANKDWLLNGKGKMFNEPPKDLAAGEKSTLEKAFDELKEQLRKKDDQIDQLMGMLANFPKPLNYTGPLKFVKNLSGELRGKTA